MIGRLRENLIYKLAALLCAIALRSYVVNQLNPVQSRQMPVSVVAKGVPNGYAVLEKDLIVMVGLEGSADQLSRLPTDDVAVQVDLTHAHPGRNTVPVTVQPIPSRDGVTASDPQPRSVTLTLEPLRTRRLVIQVRALGDPARGFAAGQPQAIPGAAEVAGLSDSVDSVAAIVVRPKLEGVQTTVEEDDPVVAVDDHGQEIPDVTVAPAIVHVGVPVVEAARERQAFVSATINGAVAPGYQIRSVSVSPDQVTVQGPAPALAAAAGIVTAPVDITGAARDVVQQVGCVTPPGLVAEGGGRVTVTVRVTPIASGAAVPGAAGAGPAAPARPTPDAPAAH
jgi:YbbR domain-containing protein